MRAAPRSLVVGERAMGSGRVRGQNIGGSPPPRSLIRPAGDQTAFEHEMNVTHGIHGAMFWIRFAQQMMGRTAIHVA